MLSQNIWTFEVKFALVGSMFDISFIFDRKNKKDHSEMPIEY